MARWYKIEPFGYITKSARHVRQNSWETEARGDIGEGEVDDFFWVAYSPIVDVDEEVRFCFSKVDDCLPSPAGLVIKDDLVRTCLC